MAGLNIGGGDKNPTTTPNTKTQTADDSGTVRFSSHPIARYTIGEFSFENGLLTLTDPEKIERFRKVLKALPRSESNRIVELDVSAAEAQVRLLRDMQGGATKVTDSSVGDRAPNNQVGKGKLEDSGKPAE